jgi:hypothetical protein
MVPARVTDAGFKFVVEIRFQELFATFFTKEIIRDPRQNWT